MGLLLMDCCLWISFAMSTGLVSMSLCSFVMQSKGGVSMVFEDLFVNFFRVFFRIVVGIWLWFF